jgi:replicative DNA helicase
MNIIAEAKIIGYFLWSENLLSLLQIERKLFQGDLHKAIYEKIVFLDKKSKDLSSGNLITELNRDRTEDISNTINEMVLVAMDSSEVFDLQVLIKELEEARLRTDAQELALRIQKISLDKTLDSSQILMAIKEDMDSFVDGIALDDKYPLKFISQGIFETLESTKTGVTTTASGLDGLDGLIGGLLPQEITVLGGRPGDGKTYAGLIIGHNIAIKGKPTVFFSSEMSLQSLARRYVIKEYFAEYSEILPRTKLLGKEELTEIETNRIQFLYEKYFDLPFLVQDKPGSILTMSDIKNNLLDTKKMYGEIGLVVVDYIQMIADKPNLGEPLTKAITRALYDLRSLAKEFDCPFLILAQVSSKSPATRSDKRPIISDLCDSGGIAQAADNIVFMYREYTNNKEADPNDLEIIVAKSRNGEIGTILCSFDARTGVLKGVD